MSRWLSYSSRIVRKSMAKRCASEADRADRNVSSLTVKPEPTLVGESR